MIQDTILSPTFLSLFFFFGGGGRGREGGLERSSYEYDGPHIKNQRNTPRY